MSGDYYICAICEDQFLSIWPDDEAKVEFEQIFGKPFSEDYTTPVCDD